MSTPAGPPSPLGDLAALAERVADVDHEAGGAAAAATLGRAEALGRLGELVRWLALVTGSWPPRPLDRVRGITVSVEPDVATSAGATVGLGWRVLTVPDPAGADLGPALGLGAAAADREIDSGADLLIVAVPGARSVVPSLATVSILTNTEPIKLLDRGVAATRPEEWMDRAVAVRDLRRRNFALRASPAELLTGLGSASLAAATGFLLTAAARRTPVILDGLGSLAAGLFARDLAYQAAEWWLAADRSPGPAAELAATQLGLTPVLDLGTALDDGTAGALVVEILRAACVSTQP